MLFTKSLLRYDLQFFLLQLQLYILLWYGFGYTHSYYGALDIFDMGYPHSSETKGFQTILRNVFARNKVRCSRYKTA